MTFSEQVPSEPSLYYAILRSDIDPQGHRLIGVAQLAGNKGAQVVFLSAPRKDSYSEARYVSPRDILWGAPVGRYMWDLSYDELHITPITEDERKHLGLLTSSIGNNAAPGDDPTIELEEA